MITFLRAISRAIFLRMGDCVNECYCKPTTNRYLILLSFEIVQINYIMQLVGMQPDYGQLWI